jgi:rhodanese-related sulfurtransferase
MSLLNSVTIAFALLGFGLSGCAKAGNKPETITAGQLKQEIKNDTSLVILDVRNPEELSGPLGHIDGVVNIPVQELESRIGELDKYKGRNIAVICRSGHRSSMAQEIIGKHGIKAKNVKGGMTAYRQ